MACKQGRIASLSCPIDHPLPRLHGLEGGKLDWMMIPNAHNLWNGMRGKNPQIKYQLDVVWLFFN